jgi:hypothetical protein
MMDAVHQGTPHAAGELADVLETTLRHGTYEGFQRTHGPRPIDYGDWCLAKADQFIGLLGLGWDPDELVQGQPPERLSSFPWFDVVPLAVTGASEPQGRLDAILRAWQGESAAPNSLIRGWAKNSERDSIVVAMKDRGASTVEIVKQLDLRAIPGLPSMSQHGVVRWDDAYNDVDLMVRIDQFISKTNLRRKAVK